MDVLTDSQIRSPNVIARQEDGVQAILARLEFETVNPNQPRPPDLTQPLSMTSSLQMIHQVYIHVPFASEEVVSVVLINMPMRVGASPHLLSLSLITKCRNQIPAYREVSLCSTSCMQHEDLGLTSSLRHQSIHHISITKVFAQT